MGSGEGVCGTVIRPTLTKGPGKGTDCLKEEGAEEEKLRSETTQGSMLSMGGGEELGMRLKRLGLLGDAGGQERVPVSRSEASGPGGSEPGSWVTPI